MASDAETAWVRACIRQALGDAGTDAVQDAVRDARSDAERDTRGDAVRDTRGDAVRDTRGDTRSDRGDDAGIDADAIWSLLTPAQRAGHAPLPDPLPAARHLLDRLSPRIERLPAARRRALLIASVSIVDRTDVLATASGLTLDELFDGTFDGLVSFVSRRYRLSDPRVRIVAHASATVAERTEAHERLAAALADTSPHQFAWHRSLASLGGSPDAVPRLLGLSRHALHRGDSVFAYRVAREAASQSEPGRLRTIAQLRAGLSALHSGHTREAREWVGAVLRSGDVMLEAAALAAFAFSVASADGHVPHADLDRLEARWRADVDRGGSPGYGRGIVLGLATAAALHAERGDASAARALVERARELARAMRTADAASASSADDIVAGVWAWLRACGAADVGSGAPGSGAAGSGSGAAASSSGAAGWAGAGWVGAGWAGAGWASTGLASTGLASTGLASTGLASARSTAVGSTAAGSTAAGSAPPAWPGASPMSPDPTVAAGAALVDAFAAVRTRGAAGARDAAHTLTDSILSLAPLDREAGRDGGTRGSATPLVEAHLRVAHWIVERAGDDSSGGSPVPGGAPRRGAVSDPGDPLLARLPLHLPFGGAFVRDTAPRPLAAPPQPQAQTQAQAQAQTQPQPHPQTQPLATVQRLFPDDEPAWLAALTAREAEVARLVVGGASNRDIAGRMHLSVRTVEVHLGRVFQKLDVHSRTQLSLLVHQGGYVETRS
jgi:DNA-binding CsgD family transcriptional regulator